jgi:hypothetical protein
MLIFRCLQGDTINRACHRTEIATHASLASVRIFGKHNASPVPGTQLYFLFRVFDGYFLSEKMQER